METRSRRRLLRVGCGTAALALAGCLGGYDPLSTGEAADPDSYELVTHFTSLGRPAWREEGRSGRLDVLSSEDAVRGSPGFDELPDARRNEVEAFVAGTDFAGTVLLYVASVGPDTCHGTIGVRDLAMDGTTLTGEVAAADTSDGDVDCGGAETHPSALIRPEFENRPERVEMRVVDGWGNGETFERPVE